MAPYVLRRRDSGRITLLICAKVQESEAWHQARTNWPTYRNAIFGNMRLFLYLVLLMSMMNCISHGTQDMYPTYLQRQLHYTSNVTALVTAISMLGACAWRKARKGL